MIPADLILVAAPWSRLDQFLVHALPDLSRNKIQRMIRDGLVSLDGKTIEKPRYPLKGGEEILVSADGSPTPFHLTPELLDLDILHEDDDIIVINKAAGMIMHPGAGVHSGTLANALAGRFAQLSSGADATRPGIVHRLDRGTSGIVVVAKNDHAHHTIASQFESRKVAKTYRALVWGNAPDSGMVNEPIARNPANRLAFACNPNGRAAETGFHKIADLPPLSYLEIHPKTGRTHQIRVHLNHVRLPVYGDDLYGGVRPSSGIAPQYHAIMKAVRKALPRTALHAYSIELTHPATGNTVRFEAPIPQDMAAALKTLEAGLYD